MQRHKNLLKILEDLKILYTDLNLLVVQYDVLKWESEAFRSWTEKSTTGILGYNQQLYVCHRLPHSLGIYNTNNIKIRETLKFTEPSGIDMDPQKKLLYIVDDRNFTILNFKLVKITSWKLPERGYGYFRGLKIDKTLAYITLGGIHQIFFMSNTRWCCYPNMGYCTQ